MTCSCSRCCTSSKRYVMHVLEFQTRGKPHVHIAMRFVGYEMDMPKALLQ